MSRHIWCNQNASFVFGIMKYIWIWDLVMVIQVGVRFYKSDLQLLWQLQFKSWSCFRLKILVWKSNQIGFTNPFIWFLSVSYFSFACFNLHWATLMSHVRWLGAFCPLKRLIIEPVLSQFMWDWKTCFQGKPWDSLHMYVLYVHRSGGSQEYAGPLTCDN